MEIFKILEQTYIEKQSQMIARAFNLYVRDDIERTELDRVIYIITNLNQHLINVLEKYLPDEVILNKKFDVNYEALGGGQLFRKDDEYHTDDIAYDRQIWRFFGQRQKELPQELVNFGFYTGVEIPLTMDLENLPQQEYTPTRFFLWFVTHVLRDNN